VGVEIVTVMLRCDICSRTSDPVEFTDLASIVGWSLDYGVCTCPVCSESGPSKDEKDVPPWAMWLS